MRLLSAGRLSALVQDGLPATDTEAALLAAFPEAAYLKAGGRVLALVSTRLGPGPLSIEIDDPPSFDRWLGPDVPIRVGPGHVSTAEVEVDLNGAAIWEPRPVWADLRQPRGERWDFPGLQALTLRYAPLGSLAALMEPGAGGRAVGDVHAAAMRRARRFVDALSSSARPGADDALPAAARGLAGLGGGFTPAGDDFLMGAMVAAWARLPASAARLCREISDAAAPHTTTVAAAYLGSFALGALPGAWHELLGRMSRGDPIEGPVERLCRTGHTSGADALAGFVMATAALGPAL